MILMLIKRINTHITSLFSYLSYFRLTSLSTPRTNRGPRFSSPLLFGGQENTGREKDTSQKILFVVLD